MMTILNISTVVVYLLVIIDDWIEVAKSGTDRVTSSCHACRSPSQSYRRSLSCSPKDYLLPYLRFTQAWLAVHIPF